MQISTLRTLSIAYLLAPNLIFVVGWFRPVYAIPVGLIMLTLFALQAKKYTHTAFEDDLSFKELALFLGIAFFWTFCSGTAGLSFQIIDYRNHNAKLFDLYQNPWPTYFPEIQQYACYYFGYYILPATVSKILGDLSETVLIFWTTTGYWLALLWLFFLVKKKLIGVLLVLFLGGIGHLLKVIFYLIFTNYTYHNPPFFVEIWSLFDQSRWVTNQIIPTMLVSGMLLYDFYYSRTPIYTFFPITLGFLWAIFPSMVLVILYGILGIKHFFIDKVEKLDFKKILPIVLAGIAFLPTFFFLSSTDNTPIHGFIWSFDPLIPILLEYFVGVCIDVVLLYVLLRALKGVDDRISYQTVLTALILLVAISFYRLGYWNDWFIRGYNPLFYIVLVGLVRRIFTVYATKQKKHTWALSIFLVMVGLSVILPVSHIVKSMKYNVITAQLFPGRYPHTPFAYDMHPNIYQSALTDTHSGIIEARQYVSAKESFYQKYLGCKNPLDKNRRQPGRD